METIEGMFSVLQNLPTGSNKRKVEYTFLDREQTRRSHDLACAYGDVNIACAWWELLCASRGLGCVMMTFPRSVLELMPDIYALLGIPSDHYVGSLMGFGRPELHYPRGVQRQGCARLQRPVIPKTIETTK